MPTVLDPPLATGDGVLIGGGYGGQLGSDMPYTRCNPWPDLDYGKVASMQLSYVVSRADDVRHVYEICHIPRQKKGHTKMTELRQLGRVLALVCAGNNDKPPIAISQDWHGSHLWIMMAFLGLLNRTHVTNVPFFNECTYSPLYDFIPNFTYCVLLYKGKMPVFNQGDAV